MARPHFESVEQYLASLPVPVRNALDIVRRTLREALPDAEETISYQIPVVRLNGTHVVYFAGYKQHYSIYPVTNAMTVELGGELAPYLAGKATIRFPLSEPVPVELIRRIAACRATEIAAHAKPKRGGPRAT